MQFFSNWANATLPFKRQKHHLNLTWPGDEGVSRRGASTDGTRPLWKLFVVKQTGRSAFRLGPIPGEAELI